MSGANRVGARGSWPARPNRIPDSWLDKDVPIAPASEDAAVVRDERGEFEAFVRPHWDAMARLARRLGGPDWEDVLQDALVLAWRKRDRYDAGRGTPSTWLLTLTADAARKHLRTDRPTLELVDSAAPSAARDLDLDRAVARLSSRQRLAVELHYFLGRPVAEIAVIMNCSAGTVKSTLSDARARMRNYLGGDYR